GARLDAGLRLVLCERAWDRANASIGQLGPFTADTALAEAGLARIAALHAHWDGRNDGRMRVGLAAWAPDLCSPELLARLGKLRSELDVLATIHLNQVWGEVAAVQEQSGVLPTEVVARAGFIFDRIYAVDSRFNMAENARVCGCSTDTHHV